MGERLAPGVSTVVVVGFFVMAMAVPFIAMRAEPTRSGLRRAALTAAVLAYGAALVAYTVLPLPTAAEMQRRCASGGGAGVRLVPFGFLADLAAAGSPAAVGAFGQPAWWQVVLNVLLFVPFGAGLAWVLPVRRVLVLALATSLLIELSQLTGLWFVYDCAYRTFDVDDLWAGVLGASIGWALSRWVRDAADRAGPKEPPA